MAANNKFFSFVVLLLATGSNLFSQVKEQTELPGSIKTIAVCSLKNNFFPDYPIDSIISNLNSLNTNKKIRYCKNTGDNRGKDLQPDYLIDLNITSRKGNYISPTYSYAVQPVYYPSRDTGRAGSIPTVRIESGSIQTSTGKYLPDQYAMDITITSKTKPRKKHNIKINGDASSTWFNPDLEFSNQIALIVELEKFLLRFFSK